MTGTTVFALPSGESVLIDTPDAELIAGAKLYRAKRSGKVYVEIRHNGRRDLLHRFLTSAARGLVVDNRDGDGLNNRRGNLRVCSQAKNCLNSIKKRAGKRNKGVYFDARRLKWWAQIYLDRRSYFLGYFDTEAVAVGAYDAKARELHGEFALLNVNRGPNGQPLPASLGFVP